MSTFQQGIPAVKPLPTGIAEEGEADKVFQTRHQAGVVSLDYGFPSSYECPQANGGKAIRRTQMNGLLYQATANESSRQRGAINTFDPNLVEKTGGYSRGAILDWWDIENERIVPVISLTDANETDFREKGPDGVNWKSCSSNIKWLPNITRDGATVIASLDSLSLSTACAFATGPYVMPFDGYAVFYTNLQSSSPVAKVPYCTYCDELTGVQTEGDQYWVLSQTGRPAVSETVELAAFSAFSECGHKLFVGIGNTLDSSGNVSGITLSESATVDSSGCGVFMVSSSGLEGSATQSMIPVKKGTYLQLFGLQTYTSEHVTSYAEFNDNRGISVTWGTLLDPGGNLTTNKETAKGTFSLSCVVTAYPKEGSES